MTPRAALAVRVLLVLSLVGATVGCEKSRWNAARLEFRELTSESTADEQQIIELARFVERRGDIKTNPFLEQACTRIGRYHARRGHVALAAAWFERAVASFPDNPSLLNLAGYYYAEQGTALARAVGMLSRAVDLGLQRNYPPRQIAFFKDSLGWALRGQGDLARALALLTEARALAPDVGIIEQHLEQVKSDLETRDTSGRGDGAFAPGAQRPPSGGKSTSADSSR